jgi:predicted lipid-binding transport protein (Tim44 family)
MSEEEIFDKPNQDPKPKPARKKKELSEAQKAALAKGRAKMAEKRAAAKAGKSVEEFKKDKEKEKAKKEKEKVEKKIAKESEKGAKKEQKQRKESLAQKRRIKKQQDALNNVMSKQKREKILDDFNDKKCDILSRCTNIDVFNALTEEFNDITDDDILDKGGKLKSKLLLKLKKYEKMDSKEIKKLNSDPSDIKEI